MNNIYIFITGSYMPKPSATALCAHKIASRLAKRGEIVHTICQSEDGVAKDLIIDGVNIHKVPTPSYLCPSYKVSYKTRRFLLLFLKLLHFYDYPMRSIQLRRNYEKALERIPLYDNKRIVLIGTYVPIEAIAAVCNLKKQIPDSKAVFYSTDTLSNEDGNTGILPQIIRRKKGVQWEKRIFECVDKVLIMECHKIHYSSSEYKQYAEKMSIVNFPLLERRQCTVNTSNKNESVLFAYAGSMNKQLRNPGFMCSTIVPLCVQNIANFIVLGGGDCDDVLKKWVGRSGGRMEYRGVQPYATSIEVIDQANILLSIGNNESPMAPSKIYEYMSTGKPIIHFYSWDKDPCLSPLRKYGNALIIKEGDRDATTKVLDFIKDIRILKFEEVQKLFYSSTPEYTIDILDTL